ncbi:hypothetical protein [Herbidospora daliensis]|uniref:hypothetical protein n=1 Tax=Herbidospora daliensis TaxID=295585 RepID=UPI0007830D10|nr:hypothetical protein [Herbidospora daliensis]
MAEIGSGAFGISFLALWCRRSRVGVAVNRIFNNAKRSPWWILAAVVFSAVLTWMTHLLTRSASAADESGEEAAGERSATICGANSGIVSTETGHALSR